MPKIPFRERPEVQELVKKLTQEGKSTTAIQKALKKTFGKAYRRKTLLADIAKYAGRKQKPNREKYTPAKYRFNWVPNKFGWTFHKKYNHMVTFEVIDKESGRKETKHVIISTNDGRKTPSTIKKEVQNIIDRNKDEYKMNEEIIPGTVKYKYSIFEPKPQQPQYKKTKKGGK